MKNWRKKWWKWLLILAALGGFCYWQNNGLVCTTLEYSSGKIPPGFDGFRIVQISDLHNKRFGKNQQKLVEATRECKPDLIVLTGDLVDAHRTNIDVTMEYIRQAVEIAPVYYVTGNHEYRMDNTGDFMSRLEEAGVTLLKNDKVRLEKNGDAITLIGLWDYAFLPLKTISKDEADQMFSEQLEALADTDPNAFQILLSHRPEQIEAYQKAQVDLVFTGHAHGGQFRLPFGDSGLIAPDQGFFPQYTSGPYQAGDTTMVVSRGLGNSVIPLRIFNYPEIVLVELRQQK